MKMTAEDIKAYRENAINILKRNSQYAAAKAVDLAFASLIVLEEVKRERDIAIDQLAELGINFGQKIDGVYLTHDELTDLLEYKHMHEDLLKIWGGGRR